MGAEDITPTTITDAEVASLLGDVLMPMDEGNEREGDWVSVFRLSEKIGEGGFGVVWRAEQKEPVKRQVAVKMIKLGMDSREVLSRFELERQVLARMTHPNIATMIDAGMSSEGRPYFVMELVKGLPLTQYCAQEKLTLRERIVLFREVCLGVQHAHQKGVIHRDLKPTNILVADVDGEAVPKIIDFGIAKAIATRQAVRAGFVTQARVALGTPLYMSPEQLVDTADVDTRSDVYSLGAMLYELITGQPPFDSKKLSTAGPDQMHRIIREEEPMRPTRRIRGSGRELSITRTSQDLSFMRDLDLITLCALAKEPQRRYATASDLAADLQRLLDLEPVAAHPPSMTYFTTRWIRRNQTVFAAVCVSTLALLGGLGLALWQASEARREKAVAVDLAERALKSEAEAEVQSQRAERAADFVTRLLDSAAAEIERGQNPTALKRALDRSGAELEALEDDTELHEKLLSRMASLYATIGDWKPALELMKKQADLMASRHGPDSREAWESELNYLKRLDDHGPRATVPPMILALRERVERRLGREDRFWFQVQREWVRVWLKLDDGARALAASEELVAEARRQKLKGKSIFLPMISHVEVLEFLGRYGEAEAHLEECRAKLKPWPEDENSHRIAEKRLLYLLQTQNDFRRGAEVLRGMLERGEGGQPSFERVSMLHQLSHFESKAGEHTPAIEHARDALTLSRGLIGNEEKFFDMIEYGVVGCLRLLSECETAADRHVEAVRDAKEACREAENLGNQRAIVSSHKTLAEAHGEAGHFDEAYAALKEVHTYRQESPDYRTRLLTREEMVDLCLKFSRHEEALKIVREAWSALQSETAAQSDEELKGRTAHYGIKVWSELSKSGAGRMEPQELSEWKAVDAAWRRAQAKSLSVKSD
jgi:eukaryotic-like serine/threonine-protein kinase